MSSAAPSASRVVRVASTLSSQVPRRSPNEAISAVVSTRGVTQVISTVPLTWSMVPRTRPRDRAFMSRNSTPLASRRVRSATVASGSVRASGGRRKASASSDMIVTFSRRARSCATSAGCAFIFGPCSTHSASYCAASPSLKARSSATSHASSVDSTVLTMGCSSSSPNEYTSSPSSAARQRSTPSARTSAADISTSKLTKLRYMSAAR
mmetsp:Transcript_2661/g.7967  ORF Transcript_2661/g.7967 Transcript_2661/m.7967 type:complete len:209 (-) Transcript_2661:749-1375(-)